MNRQKTEKEKSIIKELARLEKITLWFQEQEELDIEAGLEKVKEGAGIVSELKERLEKVENEFEEVRKDLKE